VRWAGDGEPQQKMEEPSGGLLPKVEMGSGGGGRGSGPCLSSQNPGDKAVDQDICWLTGIGGRHRGRCQ
jgi:hypothetical protein